MKVTVKKLKLHMVCSISTMRKCWLLSLSSFCCLLMCAYSKQRSRLKLMHVSNFFVFILFCAYIAGDKRHRCSWKFTHFFSRYVLSN